VIVREFGVADRPWLRTLIAAEWGLPVISISGSYDPSTLPGFVAEDEGGTAGAVTYRVGAGECEVVTLNSLRERQGVGTALLAAAKVVADECSGRLWLMTTDTNTNAIGFYERRGMRPRAVHKDFVDVVRRVKPHVGGAFRDAIEYSY
jgi:ribosomal protein S18 acetylase RimI-like enzyme